MKHLLFLVFVGFCGANLQAEDTPKHPEINEYSKFLRSFNEPEITGRGVEAPDVYRLSWMRSLDPMMIFRIEVSADGSAKLTVKKARKDQGFPKASKAVSEVTLKITLSATNNFLRLFEASSFEQLPSDDPRRDPLSTDGSEWVFEASRNATYHITTRSSPLPPFLPKGDTRPELAKLRQKSGEEIALDMASLFLILLGQAANEDLY